MEYICYNRFKSQGINGRFNIPFGTLVQEYDGFLFTQDKRCICAVTSENGWEHFRPNTFEGKHRQEMIDKLYAYYNKGKGDINDVYNLADSNKIQNTYWKNLIRTLPTDKLEQFYKEHIYK